MKPKSWLRERRLEVGMLVACMAAWAVFSASPAGATGDPSTELKTAMAHAGFAAKSETLQAVTMHLHHTLNCLVGPQGERFDAAAENPCRGQGNGYLPDLKAAKGETNTYYEAWWAAELAGQAVRSNSLVSAKAAAHIVNQVLKDASKGM